MENPMTEWTFSSVHYDPTAQNYLTATEILQHLNRMGEASPKDLAESRRRENVLRVQCRRLRNQGLLTTVGYETYALTASGLTYLETESEQQIDAPTTPKSILERNWKIRDFDELDPAVFKALNEEEFFEDPADDYGYVEGDRELTRRRIRNVKDFRLNRVIREFPRDEPVPQQCAHWMRAIVGLHFFPDANHRTAMGTLSFLLDINRIPYTEWPGEGIERAVLKSKLIRIVLVDVRFDNLWEKDELYVHWHRYFRDLLCNVSNEPNGEYSIAELRDILNYIRDMKTKL